MVYTMAADLKTTYFQGKTQKFVREWLEGNETMDRIFLELSFK